MPFDKVNSAKEWCELAYRLVKAGVPKTPEQVQQWEDLHNRLADLSEEERDQCIRWADNEVRGKKEIIRAREEYVGMLEEVVGYLKDGETNVDVLPRLPERLQRWVRGESELEELNNPDDR